MKKKANAVVMLFVMIVIAILFMGYYVMLRPYKMIEDKMVINDSYSSLNNADCSTRNGYWYDSRCHWISERAYDLTQSTKKKWLVAPFIFAVGLILWGIHASTRDDVRTFSR